MTSQNIYLIHGTETLLVEESYDQLKTRYSSYSYEVLPEKDALDALLTLVSTQSLFNPNTLIVAKSPSFLGKSLSVGDAQKLTTICTAIQSNGHALIVFSYSKVDQRKKAALILKKYGTVIEHKSFNSWDQTKIQQWITERIRGINKTLAPDAINVLETVGGTNLHILSKIIQVLDVYTGTRTMITPDDVRAISTGSASSIFEFMDALRSRDQKMVLYHTKNILDDGEPPIKLLSTTASSMRLFLQILLRLQDKQTADSIARYLHKHPVYIKKLIPVLTKNYTVADIKTAVSTLNTTDIDIKMGKVDPQKGVLLALSSILNGA